MFTVNPQPGSKNLMVGVEVPVEDTWQLSALWKNNSELYLQSSGFLNTTKPNIIMIRPDRVWNNFTFYMRYNK